MEKVVFFIIGIMLSSIGLFFMIIYANLLTLGYSFLEYVKFINMKVECLCFYLGIVIILISLERKIKNEFLLRIKT